MTIHMQNPERITLQQMQDFVQGSQTIGFTAHGRAAAYGLIQRLLGAQQYPSLTKAAKGTMRSFLRRVTGFSRAQLTRLIRRWNQGGQVERRVAARAQFPHRYNAQDIALLAAVDAAHEDLSGPAIRWILQREYQVFGHREYKRLAQIS